MHSFLNFYHCSDDAYLDNFTVTVSPSTGVNKTMCGDEIWSTTVSNVSIL